MTLECPDDYDLISESDSFEIKGFAEAIASKDRVEAVVNGKKIQLKLSFTERQRAILLAGGLLNFTKSNT